MGEKELLRTLKRFEFEKFKMSIINLEPWSNISGKVIVTDPSYPKKDATDEKLSAVASALAVNGMLRAKKGKWKACVERGEYSSWRTRNWSLTTWHSSYNECPEDGWGESDFNIDVDSGQAGIFDSDKYPKDMSKVTYFEDQVRSVTTEGNCAGVVRYKNSAMGVVSSSGTGDGIYECEEHVNCDGEVDGVRIIFLTDDDSESTSFSFSMFAPPPISTNTMLSSLLFSSYYADVVFKVAGVRPEQIFAHKCIIASSSQYIREMLTGAWAEDSDSSDSCDSSCTVINSPYSSSTIKTLLKFIYTGKVDTTAVTNTMEVSITSIIIAITRFITIFSLITIFYHYIFAYHYISLITIFSIRCCK